METAPQEWIESVLAAMTRAERASLTAGDDVWHTPGVPRLGVGRLHLADGPSGVRGESFGGERSLAFPCGIAVGATWDPTLVERYGHALAAEAIDRGVHVVLGPTVGIPRTPLGGRTFESFAEDPHLSARLAVAYVRAVEAHPVLCCVKHFACNDQEHERMTIDAAVGETALREIHLVPFEAAVREAGVGVVMAAYNRLNGTHCAEHPWLLTEVLRGDWGFDGAVVSDWLATHSTVAAATAGLDIEMPGPASHLGPLLAAAVDAGDVDPGVLDEMARRSLRLRAHAGLLGDAPAAPAASAEPVAPEATPADDPTRRVVARDLAIAATVLLRNDGVLPLAPEVTRVAVIGPNAELLQTGGGGSSQVAPLRTVSFPDELAARLPGCEVTYEPGCDISRGMPTWDPRRAPDGIALDFRVRSTGEVVGRGATLNGSYLSIGSPVPGVDVGDLVIDGRATFRPPVSGAWTLALTAAGRATVTVDGAAVLDNRGAATDPGELFGLGTVPVHTIVQLDADRDHELRVSVEPDSLLGGFTLGAVPVAEDDVLERAVAAASAADVAVVVVGTNPRWETEGADRVDLHLPGEQDELVRRVAAANPRTIVVLNAGSPVDVRAADGAAALATVWYPGEEGAAALADVVTGRAEPGGRLPITYPRTVEDVPVHGAWYPGTDGVVEYGEGLLVGYRHYDTNGVEPAFAFGHGLGYTTFTYGVPRLAARPDGIGVRVEVDVTNTGARAGSEVVQVYVHRPDAPPGRPVQALRAFAKVHIDAGATATAVLDLDARAFASWDESSRSWRVPAGDAQLRVGSSSRAIHARVAHRTPAADLGV